MLISCIILDSNTIFGSSYKCGPESAPSHPQSINLSLPLRLRSSSSLFSLMFSAGRHPLKPTEKGGKELLTSLTSKRSCGDSLASIVSGSASSTQRPAAKKARSTTNIMGASMTESVPTSGQSSPDIVKAPSVVRLAVPPSDLPSAMSATVKTAGGG